MKAIDTVLNALQESHVLEFLEMIATKERIRPGKEAEELHRGHPFQMEVMSVFRSYVVAANAFGPVETELVQMFGLGHLADSDFWAQLVFSPNPEFGRYGERGTRGANGLASLRKLVAPADIQVSGASPEEPGRALERLSIVVVEEKGHLSRPARFVNVLQGVTSLYDAHALLLSLPENTLLVAACDSGSDTAFDFLGVAKAIQALKDTILSLWDRVVFFRERKLFMNVRLVAEALPVLASISTLPR